MKLPDALNLGALLGSRGRPGDTALVYGDRAIGLGALDRAADAVARALQAQGVGPARRGAGGPDGCASARVAILCGNRPEFIAVMFGAMRAGCTAVPLDPRRPAAVTRALLDELQPARVFAEGGIGDALPDGIAAVDIDALGLNLAGDDAGTAERFAALPVGPDDLAEILYTSGSTGRPRGVPLTHRGQIWFLNAFLDATGWAPDTALVAAPLFHMNALIRVKCALATGGRIVLHTAFSPDAYLEAIERHRVTLLTGVPTMYAIVLERRDLLERIDTSSVTRVMMGSGAAPPELVDALQAAFPRATIGVAYGLTEAGGTISSTLVRAAGETPPRGSVGKPLPGIELRFGEAEGGAERGVLHVRSPATATGYFGRAEQSAERFRDGWLRTNDVLSRDAGGWLHFLSRADDMYVCGGENVYPAQVEARLLGHPQVAQAVVVPVPDRIRGQAAFAFVVLREPGAVSAGELQAYAARDAPSHLHAHHLRVLEAMSLAGTAKVDLAQLRRIAIESST